MATTEDAFEVDVEVNGKTLQAQRGRRKQVHEGTLIDTSSNEFRNGGFPKRSLSNDGDDDDDERNEHSPLLPTSDNNDEQEQESLPEWADFAHLPWYKRPSIFWLLGPFFIVACAFGGVITPKLNLILELICQRYFSERMISDPSFTMIPIDFNDGDNDQCRIADIQAQVSTFTLWCSLLAGILSAVTAPILGALSDRYGRKPILMLTAVGTIAGEIITICAALFPETFPVDMLLLGYALDGLTGSFIVLMAMSNSYAADCTPPALRSVAFAFFHGCLFFGFALGPIAAGYIVKATGDIVVVFYILTAVHVFFVFFILIFVPESLSKRRRDAAQEKHRKAKAARGPGYIWVDHIRSLNLFAPLKVLYPTGPGTSAELRRNLILLAAVDTIMFGVAMGSHTIIIIYTNYMFGWKSYESGRFMSIISSSRVFCLLVILPILTRVFRGKPSEVSRARNNGCDLFDLGVIRTAVLFDTLGYIGYTLSDNGNMMIISGVVAAMGGIASPILQSALTKHVSAEKTGQILGASGLLHALARVVSPTIFNLIYYATVRNYPQAVFVCLASTFGIAFLISWFLRPHVHFEEEKAAQTSVEITQ